MNPTNPERVCPECAQIVKYGGWQKRWPDRHTTITPGNPDCPTCHGKGVIPEPTTRQANGEPIPSGLAETNAADAIVYSAPDVNKTPDIIDITKSDVNKPAETSVSNCTCGHGFKRHSIAPDHFCLKLYCACPAWELEAADYVASMETMSHSMSTPAERIVTDIEPGDHIGYCRNCQSMTKTIKDKCGKCGAAKTYTKPEISIHETPESIQPPEASEGKQIHTVDEAMAALRAGKTLYWEATPSVLPTDFESPVSKTSKIAQPQPQESERMTADNLLVWLSAHGLKGVVSHTVADEIRRWHVDCMKSDLAAEYTRGAREELEALLTIPAGTNNSERWLRGEIETRLHQLTKEPK